MIEPEAFVNQLRLRGVSFITGVPDSLLQDLCAVFADQLDERSHVIAANEGNAIGLAIGHYLGTGSPALVYMQNSGLGNATNPIASLADPAVCGIPMILLVGWRGEIAADGSQVGDEPQHVTQGRVTLSQLDTLAIPYDILDADSDVSSVVESSVAAAVTRGGPVAIVVRKNTFLRYEYDDEFDDSRRMTRESAIGAVVNAAPASMIFVSTTGKASRELFEFRQLNSSGHHRDFLTVGGMGHASSIAAGLAMVLQSQQVACLDGDGAMIMHMGSLAITATCENLIHVVLNNGAHESVGGQPTRARAISLADVARDCGYQRVFQASDSDGIASAMAETVGEAGSSFIEIKCRRGARSDLGRPDRTPAVNRSELMRYIGTG